MANEADTMTPDSTPRASLGNHEADQAGSCFSPLKSPLSTEQLAEHLLAKGLVISDNKNLMRTLETQGYYRLSGYWITLEENGAFKPGTTLDSILEIEAFNRELSAYLSSGISTVEIWLRSQMAATLSSHYGPCAFHTPEVFSNSADYSKLQKALERETQQAIAAKKPFTLHSISKYGKLPIWAEVENSSFGTLSKAYGNLSDRKISSEISKKLGLSSAHLQNWLRYLTQIRNTCAHYDRLYNRLFCIKPHLFKEYAAIDNARLFPVFIVLFRLYDSIEPERTNLLRQQLGRIVDAHPTVDLKPVGFPENWREILRIPDPDERSMVRPRGRQGGRPLKNATVIEQALYRYDMREGAVAEIAKQCGLSLSTLYKYIHMRDEAKHIDYAVASIEE